MNDPQTEPSAGVGQRQPRAIDPSRVTAGVGNLRGHVARGIVINSGFMIGLSALGAFQRLVVAAFLTREQFGLWAIILTVLMNLLWLKDFGIADKFIQQSEPDQEQAFQKAFTLELITSIAFFCLCLVVLPLAALAYGHTEIILPGAIVSLAVPLSAFEAPGWIPYRTMNYKRQRLLTGIDPIVGFIVTVSLAIAGAGYWCFVLGALAGTVAGGLLCTLTSPYSLRWRFDSATARAYLTFSWPLVASGLSRLLLVQGSLLVANQVVGITGIAVIGLATSIATVGDRVDAIVSETIYPAVCAVVNRIELLAEVFVKSNRIALMWAMPFGVAMALFSGDVVHFALGDRWHSAAGLLGAFGLTCAFGQIAFNWVVFMRATNRTRPILIGSAVNTIVFLAVSIPALYAFGLAGYAIGFGAATIANIALRGYYMRELFSSFRVSRQLARAVSPTIPAAAVVLLVRALSPGPRSLAGAIAEAALYGLTVVACTALFERQLVAEMSRLLLRRGQRSVPALAANAPEPGARA